ncbi:alpha-ribazole phosphatase [Hahella sp. CCB-MM4]|uniref:alpha-ribazole phosphatase n=1 Tax=Hahella sp. (strain CCB-MM4) TaxID=1926491 RepID=UPI000B9BB4C1|nr:alpha-ribazole phosphatase [Hahella sp. CCB-MM4]OZG74976.1 alpha-ribazole phosphatase [Hahella sp. CCB-MM4]
MHIVLIRHTCVGVAKGTVYGQLDVPLAPSYPDELEAIRQQIPDLCHHIYSSPLSRCRILAEAISTDLRQRPNYCDLLMEMDFGEWEGQRWQDLPQHEARAWGNNWQTQSTPGGESFQDLYARTQAFVRRYLSDHSSDETVVVVAHSGVLRSLCLQLHPEYRSWPQGDTFKIPFDYGAVMSFEWDSEP